MKEAIENEKKGKTNTPEKKTAISSMFFQKELDANPELTKVFQKFSA